MSALLPRPVPLADPPGSPLALSDAVSELSAAAFRLGVLQAHLAGPAATTPGWLGRDAAEAAAQIAAVTGLVAGSHAALTDAVHRLDLHATVLRDVRRRVTALRAEQREDFAVASARLAASPPGPLSDLPSPEAVGIVHDLRRREAGRQHEHAALLAELADDTAATARVLIAGTAVVGGTGGTGDGDRVVARLAAQLPGWGDTELAARGRALAVTLAAPATAAELQQVAGEGGAFAGSAAFADALLGGLGVDGVRFVLSVLGSAPEAGSTPLARLLAGAFGSARSVGVDGDPVGEALAATYAAADDPDGAADVVVLGMVAVLTAVPAGGGPSPRTVADWGRQILARQRAQGSAVAERIPAAAAADPAALVVGLLADRRDPAAAARLLAAPGAWSVLLGRPWADHGAQLARLTELAGGHSGPDGAAAVRGALEALGSGLSPRAPGAWTVDVATAAAVAPALGAAVRNHLPEVTGLLWTAGEGRSLPLAADSAVRGLGYLTVDRSAAEAIAAGLRGWGAAPAPGAGLPPSALVGPVVGAYVAAQEYGQRLAHALHGAAEMRAAMDRWLIVALAEVATSPLFRGDPGDLAAAELPYVETGLHGDGAWDNGPDTGLVFTATDAAVAAAASLPPGAPDTESTARLAADSFGRAAAVLGTPQPPVPTPCDEWQQLLHEVPYVGPILGPPCT